MPFRTMSGAESPFDRLTLLAQAIFDAPSAMASIVEDEKTLFRSNIGFAQREMRRELSVSHLLVNMGPGAILVIPDSLEDPRTVDHPMVTGAPFLRWFAGMTITDGRGLAVGAIGVMDIKPRPAPTPEQMETLRTLAQLAGDIVDRAREAQGRDEQLTMLRMAEEMSGVGHWRWDLETDRITWSDEVYRIHGIAPQSVEPTLKAMVQQYDEADRPELTRLVRRAVEHGEPYEFRLRLTRKDGSRRWVVADALASVDPVSGKTTSLFGLLQDVTEQQETLDRVSRSEERYRLLAEHMGDVITRVRADGSSKYISPAIEALLGWTYQEMSGQALEYIHPDDRAEVVRVGQEAVRTGQRQTLQHRALHRQGHEVWVESAFQKVAMGGGKPDEVVIVIRDISARKALEDQLILEKERAEAAARTKSAFLANMSHELRTPLTSVIGFSDLLKQSATLGEAERRHVDRIAAGSEALLSVINDILDYSKLEAGAVEMDPRPFDPRKLAASVGDLIEAQASRQGLTLTVEVDEALPGVLMGDSGRLRQVLLNFMSNGVKFTAKGGVTLRLTAEPEPDDLGRTWILAEVTDTGIGLSEETAARLFQRFVQADASTTRSYGGTGLGLAISRQLIEMMGGEVGARGAPGEGSTFWFRVPLTAVEAEVEIEAVGAEAVGRAGRILVADDAPANRELVSAILVSLGLEPSLVENGVEAVEAARTGAYDLILMDVHMPVMDGLDATRAIRAGEGAAARTPILALTANVDREQVERCLEAGMDGHLAKPIAIDKLAAALAHWLGRGDETGADVVAA